MTFKPSIFFPSNDMYFFNEILIFSLKLKKIFWSDACTRQYNKLEQFVVRHFGMNVERFECTIMYMKNSHHRFISLYGYFATQMKQFLDTYH